MKFETGQYVATKHIHEAIAESAEFSQFVTKSLRRYILNDWGELPLEDARMNDSAVKNNDDRIFARYNSDNGNIYIITEYDRSYTTIMFVDEY